MAADEMMDNLTNGEVTTPEAGSTGTEEPKVSWLRQLPKELWQNEDLAKHESLSDFVKSAMEMSRKGLDTYNVSENVDKEKATELFKELKLTQEEADKIQGLIPEKKSEKTLKETWGKEFEGNWENLSNGLSVLLTPEQAKDLKEKEFIYIPEVANLLVELGKMTNEGTFHIKDKQPPKEEKTFLRDWLSQGLK